MNKIERFFGHNLDLTLYVIYGTGGLALIAIQIVLVFAGYILVSQDRYPLSAIFFGLALFVFIGSIRMIAKVKATGKKTSSKSPSSTGR